MQANVTYRTAIILQGGGALGAYECGVLKALYETRPGFQPAAVTGISIGAITAALLVGAKGDPIRTLEEVWNEHFTVAPPLPPQLQTLYEKFTPRWWQKSLAVAGNPGLYQVRPDYLITPLLSTSIYDISPLRRTLENHLDPSNLNRGYPYLAVGAINVETALMEWFDNQRKESRHEPITLDQIMASGSLPPSFPITRINDKAYWDGGLFSNTPLAPAINALEDPNIAPDQDDENRTIKRELIVVELFPMNAPIPTNLPEVFQRMGQLFFTSRLKLDEKFFNTINQYVDLFQSLEKIPDLPQEVRENPGFQALCRHKKIDSFKVITSGLPPDLANGNDFSRLSITERIERGYQDAIAQHIDNPEAYPNL